MNIELKSFRSFSTLSEETNAFTATLYVDGKKVGTVEDTGKGGDIRFHGDYKAWHALDDHCKGLPPMPSEWGDPLPMSGEFYISMLVGKMIERKQLEKMTKKGQVTVFTKKGDKTTLWSCKAPFSQLTMDKLREGTPEIDEFMNLKLERPINIYE